MAGAGVDPYLLGRRLGDEESSRKELRAGVSRLGCQAKVAHNVTLVGEADSRVGDVHVVVTTLRCQPYDESWNCWDEVRGRREGRRSPTPQLPGRAGCRLVVTPVVAASDSAVSLGSARPTSEPSVSEGRDPHPPSGRRPALHANL